MAGIVTVMLIPQSLAYALLARLPPQVGLYTSMALLALYAIFGTSRALEDWEYRRGVQLDFIRPGKPIENAFIEVSWPATRSRCHIVALTNRRQGIMGKRRLRMLAQRNGVWTLRTVIRPSH